MQHSRPGLVKYAPDGHIREQNYATKEPRDQQGAVNHNKHSIRIKFKGKLSENLIC